MNQVIDDEAVEHVSGIVSELRDEDPISQFAASQVRNLAFVVIRCSCVAIPCARRKEGLAQQS